MFEKIQKKIVLSGKIQYVYFILFRMVDFPL